MSLGQTFPVSGFVAMPVMTFRAVTPIANVRNEEACEDQDDRIDELDSRIESLHLRLLTIQRSVELQARILTEIRNSGTIGNQPLPGLGTSPPPRPEPPMDDDGPQPLADPEKAAAKEQLARTEKALRELLKKIGSDPGKQEQREQIQKALDATKAVQASGK